jgi:hypothetical protein
MGLIVEQGGAEFELCPEDTYNAVCVGVWDLGMQETKTWGTKHQIRLMWEIDHTMTNGHPFIVSSKFTASLSKNSHLFKTLTGWRGKAFTAEELKGFYIGNLLGVPCQVTIIHSEYEGKTYANVNTVARLAKGATPYKPKTVGVVIDSDHRENLADAYALIGE